MGGLPRGVATVHAEIASRHERAGVREEEHGGATVLVGGGQTAEHVVLGPFVAALGELLEELLDHGGDNVTGGDGVDADVVRTPLHGEVARELDDSGLAGIVGWADETL